MKECFLYKRLANKKVQCQTCSHYCAISPNKRGICGVRENIDGRLYALNYKKVAAINIDPIEKKPFFHFLPGTYSLSIATVGCNFKCWNCQNFDISQMPQTSGRIIGEEIAPEQIVKIAQRNKIPSVSYTYTEPTIFLEYAMEVMKIAKKNKIKNAWISNGFMSKETINLISPYLDAANIDLKSFDDKFYIKYAGGRLDPVLETLKRLREKNIWVEVTTLVIPSFNDSDDILSKIASFIKNKLGDNVPWHISRFSGTVSWKFKDIPDTPLATLEKAYQIGKSFGLKYVYIGNAPNLKKENTFCPKCGALVIERDGYSVKRFDKNGKCPKCGALLDIIVK